MSKVRIFQDPHQQKRLGADNCPWGIEWRENGRRRSKVIGSKDDAADAAALKQAELLQGIMGLVPKKRWAEFVDEYLADMEGRGNRPGTLNLVATVLKTFAEKVHPQYVSQVDERMLDRFRTGRLKDKGPKGKISPETVKKELRQLRAALGVARRWKYLKDVPILPRVVGDQREKVHVTEPHFLAMLNHVDAATRPDLAKHNLAEGATIADWWRALLITLWVTGARIESVLRLRWEDVDWETGRVLSRAADLKQRKDTRPEIRGALAYLVKIRGDDPRLLPWNHGRRSLYPQLHAIQRAAKIDLTCPKQGLAGHECTATCHVYGFHALRYTHARFNYANPELQNQMGHAYAGTTEHYRQWAERRMSEYGAYLPAALEGGKEGAESGKTAGEDSGKPNLRVVRA
ncbi:MAG TPA: hypothetical protein VMY37_30080 [Thermoguttaceae bacterium]|nr:hypothetical protein [Phycisphaerae bacterium]HUT93750.1 hypothetical protein [Thermoguttaceae bacterium]